MGVVSALQSAAQVQGQPQQTPEFLKSPLFTDALDYTSVDFIEECAEEVVRVVKYHACRDSEALYDVALAKAKENGQPLLVIFGFNKCPYCTVLERNFFNPENPVRNMHIAGYFSRTYLQAYVNAQKSMTIPVLRLHARSKHGLALADKLGVTQMAKERGWHRVWSPFLVMVNPQTGAMASQSEWEAKEVYCDWPANIVVTLEDVGFVSKGIPYTERKRCVKS